MRLALRFVGGLPEYTLSYPNNEVEFYSLMSYLLENYLTDDRQAILVKNWNITSKS